MKCFVKIFAVTTFACLGSHALPQADPYAKETKAQRDARMKWFREARFGMFIHWGVYSVPAGVYEGKPIGGIGEWIMHQAKIPTATYQEYAKQFNPVNFDAEKWVKIAKNAGMKYIVITSKHHDGFAMFDSQASPWNIVKASPFKRDPLKELAEACKRNGIKLGFYYSQAQDWNNPGGAAAGGHWDPKQDGDMTDYIKNIAVPQVREILSNYGNVACLWWDTPYEMTKERADLLLPLLRLQPGIIYNNRLGGGYKGDTETPEQFVPATGYPGRDWETCMTMNDTWGYKSTDHNWKSTQTIIQTLVDIASKGGNYLLNVGPTNLGEIPAPSVERLKAVGDWMKLNGKAIYGTSASPFKSLTWGRCTKSVDAKGATLYLHVFQWPTNGELLVPGLTNVAESASMLVGGAKVPFTNIPEGVMLKVPTHAPNVWSSTIVLRVRGPLNVVQPEIGPNSDGSVTLKPSDADFHGEMKSEAAGRTENIGFWTNPSDYAEWTFRLPAGTYAITTETAALDASSILIKLGDTSIAAKVEKTGDYKKYTPLTLGTLNVSQSGKVKLQLRAEPKGWHPVNVRAIRLMPVKMTVSTAGRLR